MEYFDVLGYVSIMIISVLSTLGGFGGGGLFLPIFILIFDIEIKYSIPLSIISVFASCIGRNIYYLNKKRNIFNKRYLINHTPGIIIIAFGSITSFTGILLNEIIPKIISLGLIIVILGISFYKILRKAIKMKKQSQQPQLDLEQVTVNNTNINQKGDTKLNLLKFNLLMFFTYIVISLYVYSIKQQERCSNSFYQLLILQILTMTFIGIVNIKYLVNDHQSKVNNNYYFADGDVKWNFKEVFQLALASCVSGLCSTYLGIGPGIILSPVLFSIGMTPKILVTSAPLFMMYGTAIAITQFIIFDRIKYEYTGYSFIASLLGSFIGVIINRFNRQYLIVFLLAFLIACSAISLLIKLIVTSEFDDLKFNSICD